MSRRSWSLAGAVVGAVALPALLAFLGFLLLVAAGDSDVVLVLVWLPVLLIPAAIVGAVLGALIGTWRGKGR
jgi:ABC-type Na+ efflux pump permease subunit